MPRRLGGSAGRLGRRAGAACHTWAQPRGQSCASQLGRGCACDRSPGWSGGGGSHPADPRVTRLCCPADEMRTLEGKPSACLLVFLQLLPSPPEVVGTLGGPGNPGMRPQASPSISPSPRKVGGTAGRVSRRSPQPPSPPQTLSASRFLSSPGCKAHTDVGLSGAIRGLR